MSQFLGLYPRLDWFAPLVLGKGMNREWTRMHANGAGERVIRRWRRLTQMGGWRHWGM